MEKKLFYFKIVVSDLLNFATEPDGENMTLLQFAKELHRGESSITYIQQVIGEAIDYKNKKAKAGSKGGLAKASTAIAKPSTAIANASDALANSSQKQKQKHKTPSSSGDDVSVYPEQFEKFWEAYPKKVGKGAAFKAWKKEGCMKLNGRLCAAIEEQKKTDQWKRENGQYIPHPSTWLNQRRWEDSASTEPEGGYIKKNTGLVY